MSVYIFMSIYISIGIIVFFRYLYLFNKYVGNEVYKHLEIPLYIAITWIITLPCIWIYMLYEMHNIQKEQDE